MMIRRLLGATVIGLLLLPGCGVAEPTAPPVLSAPTAPPGWDEPYLANLTPYSAPSVTKVAAPAGYAAVFSENVARHGSRALTSDDSVDRVQALWQKAAAKGALTTLGAELGPAVQTLSAALESVGYGNLSGLGEQEHRELGQREAKRLSEHYWAASKNDDPIEVYTSGRARTEASAVAFVAGLRSARSGLAVAEAVTDERLLHFDTTDPEYRNFLAKAKTWRKAYEDAVDRSDLEDLSEQTLRRLYSSSFVKGIDDPSDEAEALWDLYRIAPDLVEETEVDLTRFMEEETAAAFAFKEDARYFYSRGPGVAGDARSYQAAQILLDDFVAKAQQRLDGGRTAAVFRFAHAEEITPFAALLELPGNSQLSSTKQIYSWSSSDFRVAETASMASNIGWTVWRNGDGAVLVSVTHNEKLVRLGRDCEPISAKSTFYAWDEIKTCLAA